MNPSTSNLYRSRSVYLHNYWYQTHISLFNSIDNRRLWRIHLKTRICHGTGVNSIPVLIASDDEAFVDICQIFRQLYEIVAIQIIETETVIKLKCLSVPTTEFIRNAAFPYLLQNILERDSFWGIFPPSFISSIELIVTAVIENLGTSNTTKSLCFMLKT